MSSELVPGQAVATRAETDQVAGTRLPPLVGIVMGSDSDWPTMQAAAEALDEFGVPWEARVLSAHRTPRAMLDWSESAADRGCLLYTSDAADE